MRIVIVEDAAPIREGMGKILKRIGKNYELAGTAADGVEGLKLIEEVKPDLVITDIRMPDMDGLTMLKEIRKREIDCKVIVLTAYSDFNYAKEAIEQGIENYLLKPIKIQELKRALRQVEESMTKEVRADQVYTPAYIFKSALAGHLEIDDRLTDVLRESYKFLPEDPVYLLVVWLGSYRERYRRVVRDLLENLGANSQRFDSYLLEFEEKPAFFLSIYHVAGGESPESYIRQSVVPMLASNLGHRAVYSWGSGGGLAELKDVVKEAFENLEWNLVFGEGALITGTMVRDAKTMPIKYPMELEQKVRHSVANRDEKEFRQCFQTLASVCEEEPHAPKEIKEACVRYGFAALNAAKEYGSLKGELSAQVVTKRIADSVTWEEILSVLMQVFDQISPEQEEIQGSSLLIQKARTILQEYYNQGITLEETARKLCVTDEYLSAQFKKETGKTFSETIRSFRIDKVKKLLLESDLKLNQIAAMTGYADPKYMSKVFKEEVGMLPAEYRKMNS